MPFPTGPRPAPSPLRDLAASERPVIQVRLYTAHVVVSGRLRLEFNRLSDQLNFGSPLLELEAAGLSRPHHTSAHHTAPVAQVRRDSIVLALDRVSAHYPGTYRALHEDKPGLAIAAALGHLIVSGRLHLARGTDLATWLHDGQLFVPLTAVTIYAENAPPVSEPMAIINRAALAAILL